MDVLRSPDGDPVVPAVGDVVGLPPWLRQLPYRVERATPSPIPDWLRLDGYLIEADGRHRHRRVDVPPRQLRRLPARPDTAW
ncbi:MAG TPA: hypothetical protein VGN37_19560 [Actinocatenispora sp.]